MGSAASKEEEVVDTTLSCFSKEEQQRLLDVFKELAPDGVSFTVDRLQSYVSRYFPKTALTERLHDEMSNVVERVPHRHTVVTYTAFVLSMLHLLKGNIHEKSHIIRRLAADRQNVSSAELIKLLEDLSNAYLVAISETPYLDSWRIGTDTKANKRLARVLLHELFYKEHKDQNVQHEYTPSQRFDEKAIELWLSKTPIANNIIDTVFNACFRIVTVHDEAVPFITNFTSPNLIPLCHFKTDWSQFSTLLDLPSLVLLNSTLPSDLRRHWRLLHSSLLHGQGLSTVVRNIERQGPTIIIIRDTDGGVFGGFASTGWEQRPQFQGDSKCFLFTLQPVMGVYTATGLNHHYMYMEQSQETLPNGLGMGGQLGYFGLWLDGTTSDLELHGSSQAEPLCTTYDSPQLSCRQTFKVDTLEVWGVGPVSSQGNGEHKESILDVDPEAKAMLALANRGPHSEGLRDRDPFAHIPEKTDGPFSDKS